MHRERIESTRDAKRQRHEICIKYTILRMAWHRVCEVAGLDPEDVTPFEVAGKAIAVCMVDGAVHAFADRCTHEEVALSGGFLMGAEIECPLHGARFCVRTGRCLSPPASVDVAVYPAKIEDGALFVELEG